MNLRERLTDYSGPLLLYGMTPPRAANDEAKRREIAARQIERLRDLPADGLILYDLQDEASRVDRERPFPFSETIDPFAYSEDYLGELDLPRVIYRCAGKYAPEEFARWLEATRERDICAVFVGAAAAGDRVRLPMREAFALRERLNPRLALGGVAIPERHRGKGDEHLRMQSKYDRGCRYFVTQAIYNTELIKDLLSDYRYDCLERGRAPVPIVFTLAVCGSPKTLDFMKWLGIDFPRWLENDLLHAEDILRESYELCLRNAREIRDYCEKKKMPYGFNVESVSIRKEEIECSIELLREVDAIRRGG